MKTLRDGWYVAGADGHAQGPMTRLDLLDAHRRGAFPPDALAWHVEIAEWRPLARAAPATPAADAARSAHSAQSGAAERIAFDAPPPPAPAQGQSAAQRRAQQQRPKAAGKDGGQRLLSASASQRQQALAALAKAGSAANAQGGVAEATSAQRPGARPKPAGAAGAKDASASAAAALECLRRFFARAIDTLTLGFIVAIVIWHYAARTAPYGPELAAALVEAPAPVVQWMLAFAALVPLEALMIALTGTTPGKALLGLRIVRADGTRPGPLTALGRAIDVYLRGIALGIPVIAFFAMLIAGARRLNHGRASWDQRAQLVVAAAPLSAGRWQLALMAFIAAWVALSTGLWEQLLYGSGLLH